MTAWRFIAQRALTGELLDLELPFLMKTLRWDLSGPGVLTGTIAPDTGTLRAPDGRLLLEEWGTYLYAEADGVIRWGGIVVSSKFEGKEWQVEASGFTTYPNGLPFTSTYYAALTDPADIVRELWAHVQSHRDGDLGVVVKGTTPVRVGTLSTEKLEEATAAYNAAKKTYDAENADLKDRRKAETDVRKVYSSLTATKTARSKDVTAANKALTAAKRVVTDAKRNLTAAKKTKDAGKIAAAQRAVDDASAKVPAAQSRVNAAKATLEDAKRDQSAQKSVVDTYASRTDKQAAIVKSAKAAATKANDAKKAAKKAEDDDGGAYRLNWWETPDVGQEIDKLAQEAGFDYVESHRWDGSTIRHEVTIGYPRIGRRRADLAFVQGDNVVSLVAPTIDGGDFANEVVGLGAGEGKGALRRTTAVRDGRLRRTAVLKAKDVKKASRMDALIRDELTVRLGELHIDSVEVLDHPNASIGSWSVGDDVLIEAQLPWLGDVALWCRITSWELLTESRAKLTLARSDSFTYGG